MYQITKHCGCYTVVATLVDSELPNIHSDPPCWKVDVQFPWKGERRHNIQMMKGRQMRYHIQNVVSVGRVCLQLAILEEPLPPPTRYTMEELSRVRQRALSDFKVGTAGDLVNMLAWYGTPEAERIYNHVSDYIRLNAQ